MDLIPQKHALRRRILEQRNQLPADMHQQLSQQISQRLTQLSTYRQSQCILGYMNFGSELISRLWIARVLADRKRLILPRVNTQTKQLDLYEIQDLESQLETGAWGIPEPKITDCRQLNALNEVEFVLLPGVAFSRNGARLGYGGGFYDKLLARLNKRPWLAAAAYSMQLVPHIPEESTDIRVDQIVTEQQVIDCQQQ